MSKTPFSQKGTIIPGLIILVLILMLVFMFFVMMLGFVKKKFDGVCKWQAALNIILGADKQKTLDEICRVVRGNIGGVGVGASGCAETALNMDSLRAQLTEDEKPVDHAYQDSRGFWTIGIGHLLDGGSDVNLQQATGKDPSYYIQDPVKNTMTQDQMNQLFDLDIQNSINTAKNFVNNYDKLPATAKQILAELAFQLGGKLDGFIEMKKALENINPDTKEPDPDFKTAAQEIRNSDLYKQTTNRTENQAQRMENIRCEIAVIPLPSKAGVCALEMENGAIVGTYKMDPLLGGGEFKVYKNVADKYNLVPMDSLLVPYFGTNLYASSIVYEQLKEAINDSSCQNCFKITSAYRNCTQQSGSTAAVKAKAGESNHNIGYAVDINASKAGWTCSNDVGKCSVDLVKLMEQYGFKHINKCGTLSGNYYTGADCVHFSANNIDED